MSTLRVNEISARTGTGDIAIPSGNRIVSTEGGAIVAPGTVLQVATASSGPARQTIASATPVAVTGLSINFTPIFASSLILVQAQILSNLVHVSSFGIFQDGSPTVSTAGQTNSNEPNMNITTYIGSTTAGELWVVPIMWSGAAGSTTPRTYDVRGTANWSGGTIYSLTVNNRDGNDMAGFSTMVVMEIAQ